MDLPRSQPCAAVPPGQEDPEAWWYGAVSGERIHLCYGEHFRDLFWRQREYGVAIDPEWGGNTRKDAAFAAGWVRVRFRPETGEIDIEGPSRAAVRAALRDALGSHPHISQAMVEVRECYWRLDLEELGLLADRGRLPRKAF